MDDLAALSDTSFCYLTTTGRRSGRPHEIEIWFGWDRGMTIYLMAGYLMAGGGERSDWVRNLGAGPSVTVRIRDVELAGTARVVTEPDEDALARRLLAAKYQGWHEGTQMSDWATTALPVAVELTG